MFEQLKKFYATYALKIWAAVVIAVLLMGGYVAVTQYNKKLQKAAEHEAVYVAARERAEKELAAEKAKREALEQEQQQLSAQIAKRDAAAKKTLANVTRPKPVIEIQQDMNTYVRVPTKITPENNFELTPPSVQQIVAMSVKGQRDAADLKDVKRQLFLEQKKCKSFEYDTKVLRDSLGQCEQLWREYKTIATKKQTKFRIFLGGAKKVAIIGGVGFAAFQLGRAVGR